MTDLVSRLRVDVTVGDGPAKVGQVTDAMVGLRAGAAAAQGGLVQAAAGAAEMQAAQGGAAAASGLLSGEVRQLQAMIAGLAGTLQVSNAATIANAEAVAGATAAITGQALATRELGVAQAATNSGSAAASSASKTLAGAAGEVGEAMGGASTGAKGLLALVGGPVALGVLAASVAMEVFKRAIDAVNEANERIKQGLATSVDILGDLKKQAEETADYTVKLSIAMGDSATNADTAADAYDRQAAAAAGAAREIRDMTLAQQVQELKTGEKQLKDLKAAQRTTGLVGLVTTDDTERAARSRQAALNAGYSHSERLFASANGTSDAELMARLRANRPNLAPDVRAKLDIANRDDSEFAAVTAAIRAQELKNEETRKILNGGQPEGPNLVDEITVTADRNKKTRADTKGFNAGVKLSDLTDQIAAENARTAAIIAGGKALDDQRVADAGLSAVQKTSLADKPKLTAAEQALVGSIRDNAEALERLKIANERLAKGAEIQHSAEADTAALKERSIAAAQGEAALEALAVKEAGLDALRQIGVTSLDQLTGKTLEQAKATMAAAQAAQAQAIATAKDEAVAGQIRDLDQRIASEKGYAEALAGGEAALVAYQRAEFVRQETEKAGKNLTAEQTAALKAKAEALFAVQAAGDSAALDKRQADELRLAKLTNQERAIEERFLQRKSLLLAEHADWTEKEVNARARALALADQAAAEDAEAIGRLRESLEDTFVKTGKLAFDDIADYAEQELRRAVYKALLEKPIEMVINAVVNGVSGAGGQVDALAKSIPGLSSASAALAKAAPMIAAAYVASKVDSAISGGLAKALGGDERQVKNAKKWGQLGVLPGIIAALVGGKKSNSAAVLGLDATGNVISTGGDKRTADTTGAATSAANGIAALEQALIAAGATLKTTVTTIDLGVRDQTHIGLSNGQALQTAVGDAQAAIDAASKAIIAGATFATDAQTAFAKATLAAGGTLQDVVSEFQAAAALPKAVDDAIKQLVDPAAFDRDQAMAAIEDSYKALKDRANELIAEGLVTGDVLAKIDQLRDLQVADELKKLADAAAEAAAQLAETAAQAAAQHAADVKSAADLAGNIELAILKITNPDEYAKQSAIGGINSNYENLKAQAEQLIALGVLSADVLTKLDQMRDLQIDEALASLTDHVDEAAKAFADARPRLEDWLDSLSTSASSPLNAFEQRQAAMASYERQLELAKGGNADALSAITGYANELLSSDREATSSAADRAALYAKVQADIEALAARGALAEAAPMQVQIAAPDLAAFTASIETSGDKLSARLDAIASKVAELAKTSDKGSATLVGEVVAGLREIGQAVSAGMTQTSDALDHLASAQDLATATLRRLVN